MQLPELNEAATRHRVLTADGRRGGFSANGGVSTKLRMLLVERARLNGPGLFD